MNVRSMFPHKYATGADLEGREVNVTISGITTERMYQPGGGPVDKYVVHFRETQRGVVLTRILAEQISKATGYDDTNYWSGRQITLYPETIMVAGEERIVIRAKTANGGNHE